MSTKYRQSSLRSSFLVAPWSPKDRILLFPALENGWQGDLRRSARPPDRSALPRSAIAGPLPSSLRLARHQGSRLRGFRWPGEMCLHLGSRRSRPAGDRGSGRRHRKRGRRREVASAFGRSPEESLVNRLLDGAQGKRPGRGEVEPCMCSFSNLVRSRMTLKRPDSLSTFSYVASGPSSESFSAVEEKLEDAARSLRSRREE